MKTTETSVKLFNKPKSSKRVKLCNWEILNLHESLKQLKVVPGIKLNYAINRTLSYLSPLSNDFQMDKVIPVLPEYKLYEADLTEAYREIAKDKDGNVRTKITHNYRGEQVESLDIDLNGIEAVTARSKVQSKHKQAIDNRIEQVRLYNEWLHQECEEDYKLFYVSIKDMPQGDDDNKALWDACSPLIKELDPDLEQEWNTLMNKILS